jgi:hypothetical protein
MATGIKESKNIAAVLKKIEGSVANAKPKPVKLNSTQHDIGNFVRQGDVYFELINKPAGKLENYTNSGVDKNRVFNGQLAEGNTRGSRHCLNPKSVKAFIHPTAKDPITDGPILQVLEDCEVTHPDHGHVWLQKGDFIHVTYQNNVDLEGKRARARD